jgi:hypothetical protein
MRRARRRRPPRFHTDSASRSGVVVVPRLARPNDRPRRSPHTSRPETSRENEAATSSAKQARSGALSDDESGGGQQEYAPGQPQDRRGRIHPGQQDDRGADGRPVVPVSDHGLRARTRRPNLHPRRSQALLPRRVKPPYRFQSRVGGVSCGFLADVRLSAVLPWPQRAHRHRGR